jgi:serine/threonine protein kinase
MRHAILVGIDQYPDAPLAACVRDAMDMAACLSLDQYGFDCTTLCDHDATRTKVLQTLSTHCYRDSPGDIFLFYFAGHGVVVGNSGHLVTIDAHGYDPGISLAHLAQLMESASNSYAHVISILDCCHSGEAYSWVKTRPLHSGDVEREVPVINESRCVVAACRPEQLAREDFDHGLFTQVLIDGLVDAAADGRGDVTLYGLADYISRALEDSGQAVTIRGDIAGTVILGRGFEPRRGTPIDAAEMQKILGKAHHFVDEYYQLQQRELADRDHLLRQGSMTCAGELERIISWFDDTESSHGDLQRSRPWIDLRSRLTDFRKQLQNVVPGQVTSHGTVVRLIGSGGYGQVVEIVKTNGERLAFKSFHANELDDNIKVQRFKNGYINMRSLNHKHVVRVHEMTLAPFGFTMDAIPGENLRNVHINRDDPELVLRLLLNIAETVNHAHSKGVRHRDIKPENIILVVDPESGTLEPYLTDFDLAYHETNRTVTTNLGVGGVINYAAPEQLYEPNAATARAATVDIFSFAQLAFFIITGRDPSGEDFLRNTALLKKTVNTWIDDSAAKPLLELYELSTQKNPDDRPQTITECIGYLSRAEAAVQRASGRDEIAPDDYCRRLGHLYAGIDEYRASDEDVDMKSRSDQVDITVRLVHTAMTKGVETGEIEIELSSNVQIPVPGFKSGKGARNAINDRLRKRLIKYPGAKLQPGHKGVYQAIITVPRIPLTTTGLIVVHGILTETVAGIEEW